MKLHHISGKTADIVFLILFCVYNIIAHTAVVFLILHYNLDTAPALVLSIEQVCYVLCTDLISIEFVFCNGLINGCK